MKADNKKIARNTLYMYLRLMVTIPLAFYTSRVVIQELGVDDYGVYQAIAGIIAMFTTLRTAFDSATQRYYNVAIAQNDESLLSQMYSSSLFIHSTIAVALVIIIEIFGTWFIKYKMNYPIEQASDVYFVFHTMVISVIFMVLTIPYSGMIVAKEHMKFYAYLSIIDVVLKLGLVFLLVFIKADKLRVYAVFQMSVFIILFILNYLYFRKNFTEVRIKRFSKKIIKNMSSFSGWAFLGNICYSLVHEGVNLLLNVFGGVIANAARGIAIQVRGVISNILTTTIMSARPQATQLFVLGERTAFWDIIYRYSKILFLLSSLMVIPIFIYSKEIINLWLGVEPQYSVIFLQLLMLYTLIRSFHEPLDIVFKSSGRMKVYQLTTVSISSMTFFLGWFLLKRGFPIFTPFIILCIIETVLLFALIYQAKVEGITYGIYAVRVLKPCCIYALFTITLSFTIKTLINNWFVSLTLSELFIVICIFIIGLTKNEKEMLITKIKDRMAK